MRALSISEFDLVGGGVDQDTAINGNLGIVGIGVGILAAGATAPAWFPVAMIGVSVSLTASYLMGEEDAEDSN